MSNPEGTKKIEFLSHRTDYYKNLGCESLYIADNENVNISSFDVLDIELWLDEVGDLHTNNPLSSFKFIQ